MSDDLRAAELRMHTVGKLFRRNICRFGMQRLSRTRCRYPNARIYAISKQSQLSRNDLFVRDWIELVGDLV